MDAADARALALALPATEEAPHHSALSWRVGGRIYATLPPGGAHLHVLFDPPSIDAAVARHPWAERLYWGERAVGVRIRLEAADPAAVHALLEEAWARRAPRRLRRR